MTLPAFILILIFLMLLGSLPRWSHSRNWGFYPSSGLGVVFVIVAVLVITNRI